MRFLAITNRPVKINSKNFVIVQLQGGFCEKGGDVLVTCTRIFYMRSGYTIPISLILLTRPAIVEKWGHIPRSQTLPPLSIMFTC